jgi:hypothetical protein
MFVSSSRLDRVRILMLVQMDGAVHFWRRGKTAFAWWLAPVVVMYAVMGWANEQNEFVNSKEGCVLRLVTCCQADALAVIARATHHESLYCTPSYVTATVRRIGSHSAWLAICSLARSAAPPARLQMLGLHSHYDAHGALLSSPPLCHFMQPRRCALCPASTVAVKHVS